MQGKVIDLNSVEAFINLQDGRTVNICRLNLPEHIKIGDPVSVTPPADNISCGVQNLSDNNMTI